MANDRNAGRKPLYNVPSEVVRVLVRTDKKKEMKAEIKAVQEKYKTL